MFRSSTKDVPLHLWPSGSPEATDYLLFRDWLRSRPDDRFVYEETKRSLAGKYWCDMNCCAQAKGRVISEIKKRAKSQRDAKD